MLVNILQLLTKVVQLFTLPLCVHLAPTVLGQAFYRERQFCSDRRTVRIVRSSSSNKRVIYKFVCVFHSLRVFLGTKVCVIQCRQ